MNINYTPSESDIPSHLTKMRSLYSELFSQGKHYRGALVGMVCSDIDLDEASSATLSRTAEYIHNSSLLHDDVVDNSILRRGKTAAWKKYGGGYAVLAGDYLLARVIKDLCCFSRLNLVEYTSDTILSLIEGEWLQDDGNKNADLTKEHIQEVHRLKTGALFSWCFKAPLLLAEANNSELRHAVRLGELFGSLLQRSDDLLDFNIRNYENKSYFNDLPSGNVNLFAYELLKDKSIEEKKKAFEFKELEEFTKHYSLEIKKHLTAYDDESMTIANELKDCLNEMTCFSDEFKKELSSMADLVYWRK